MPSSKCYPINDPSTVWSYCPSFAAAITVCIFFGIPTIIHIIQAIHHRKPFASVLIMAGLWETAGYAFRTVSVQHQLSSGIYTAQQLFILLAPLWINAFVYMVLGRLIHFSFPPGSDRIYKVRARRITLMFVLIDIVAFLVQAAGGSMTSGTNTPPHLIRLGLDVYMGGVGIQILSIAVFIALAARFQHLLPTRADHTKVGLGLQAQVTRLLATMYVVLGLIIARNIFRLVEFSSGIESTFTLHEAWVYVFDALPMLLALMVFNCFHPGRVLVGERSDFSAENKAIKAAKRERKAERKQAKDEKKMLKREKKAANAMERGYSYDS